MQVVEYLVFRYVERVIVAIQGRLFYGPPGLGHRRIARLTETDQVTWRKLVNALINRFGRWDVVESQHGGHCVSIQVGTKIR